MTPMVPEEVREANDTPRATETSEVIPPSELARAIRGLELLRQLQPSAEDGSNRDNVLSECPSAVIERHSGGRQAGERLTERYEILETIGEGGFGTVLLARDLMLGRKVAIKIPQPGILFSDRLRQRFLAEGQAVAELDHPGILPVFDAGADGSLFYIVMAYCRGPSLAYWLREHGRIDKPRTAAWIVLHVADAAHHAHTRGKLHRDIKPSNILLEPTDKDSPHDFKFQPKLADFGLSKNLDGVACLTGQSEVLGTRHYMSPEQARADHKDVGVPTDVYALGVVLYELLVGAPPFADKDGADWWQALVHAAPAAIRQARADVARDLESICLKCLEKSPGRRYSSAANLADDLRRFLNGEAVSARPVTMSVQVWRRFRRYPVISALATALLLTLILSLPTISWMYTRERAQRLSAERSRATARQAVDDMYTQVAEKWLNGEPHMQEIQREFLLKALGFYETAAAEAAFDESSRNDLQVALHRAATIHALFGESELAIQRYRECLSVIDGLIHDSPNPMEYRYAHFHNLLLLGGLLRDTGQPGEGNSLVEQAYTELVELLADFPRAPPEYHDAYASILCSLSPKSYDKLQITSVERLLTQTMKCAVERERQFPAQGTHERHAIMCCDRLAELARDEGRSADAERYARLASQRWGALAIKDPRQPGYRESQMRAVRILATLVDARGDLHEARGRRIEAFRAGSQLVRSFPSVAEYRRRCADAQYELAELEVRLGEREDARKNFEVAIRDMEHLVGTHPTLTVARDHLIAFLETCPIEDLRDASRARELREQPIK